MSKKRHVVDLNKKNPCYRMHRVIPEFLQTLPEEKYLMFMHSINETYLKGNDINFGDPQDQALFNLFKTILDYENIVKPRNSEQV